MGGRLVVEKYGIWVLDVGDDGASASGSVGTLRRCLGVLLLTSPAIPAGEGRSVAAPPYDVSIGEPQLASSPLTVSSDPAVAGSLSNGDDCLELASPGMAG